MVLWHPPEQGWCCRALGGAGGSETPQSSAVPTAETFHSRNRRGETTPTEPPSVAFTNKSAEEYF